jgi:hypothetical protein
LALAVPLSRFTPRVGGGSAFFVRQQDNQQQIHIMKKQITSLILASAVVLVFTGCATEHHSTAYDYKIIKGPIQVTMASGAPNLDQKLDQATAEGWQVVSSGSDNETAFIVLKRAK